MRDQAEDHRNVDAAVIGGGFYGCAIALYLAHQRGLKDVLLIEREPALMTRASYTNQARVHYGYHYPRSYTTAYRSRLNLPRFVRDWPSAVSRDFTKIYAIARRNSKVTGRQYQRFCKEIGARLEPADLSLRQLFDARLIESVFLAEEYVFDATKLAQWAADELARCGVEVLLATLACEITSSEGGRLRLRLRSPRGDQAVVTSRYAFNCTYSGLNQLGGSFPGSVTQLKHEITELALMQVPSMLAGLGITVMDGPFFSVMPFPARGLHTLSHVRYTPHFAWLDAPGIDPYGKLRAHDQATRVERMIRDAARYLPAILDCAHMGSLFEVKTVLLKNEADDGRPILFEQHPELPGCYSVLGAKIDNIYDVFERLSGVALD